MRKIDLNCDMGESFGVYRLGMDTEVIRWITSANIACGFHAGDPRVMSQTVKMAAELGVGVGAHPGLPDLLGFGRRNINCTPGEIMDYVVFQVGALQAFCALNGVGMQHVKAHGSLYNMAAADEDIARAIVRAVAGVDRSLLLVGMAGPRGGHMARIGREEGVKVVFEAFPDRAYASDGSLIPRQTPGALIEDSSEASERAVKMVKEGCVVAVDGSSLPLEVHTLCVHGDAPTALELVKRLRERFDEEGITVAPMSRFYLQ